MLCWEVTQVGLPDIVHREAILKLVLAKEHLHERFDYALVAAETEG